MLGIAFVTAELQEVPVSPFLQPTKVPLDLPCHVIRVVSSANLLRAHCPAIKVITEDIKGSCSSRHPQGMQRPEKSCILKWEGSPFEGAFFLLSLVSNAAVKQTQRFDPVSHSISSPGCFFGGKLKRAALILHMKRGFHSLYITEGQYAENFLILHVSKKYSCKSQIPLVYRSVAQCVPSMAQSR